MEGLVFLLHKKNTASRGEENGRIIPVRDAAMYLYCLPLRKQQVIQPTGEREAQVNSSIAQS